MSAKRAVSVIALLCVSFILLGAGARPSFVGFKDTAVTTSEKKLVGQINQPRAKAEKSLLKLDFTLCDIARKRAKAYIDMQSFTPNIDGMGTLEQMVKSANLKVLALDEYVSKSKPEKAVAGWIASGGASIMDEQFNFAGAGIAQSGDTSLSVVIFAKMEAPESTPTPTPIPTPAPTEIPNTSVSASPTPVPSASPVNTGNPSTPNIAETPVPGPQTSAPNAGTPTQPQTATSEITRVTDGTPSGTETDFLVLLNKQRSGNGIAELKFEKNAQKAAQFRAWEVSDTAKYSAESPAYGDLKSLLKTFKVPYNTCAQALTRGGGDSASAVKALLKSPTYRKILLSKEYGYAGVGVSSRGTERIFIVYLTN